MTLHSDARLSTYTPAVLSLIRIIFGLLFLLHGVAGVFGWPAESGPAAPVGAWPFWWGAALELVTGLLITIGLFTRIAAFVASGVMAFAYFTQHLSAGFLPTVNGGETAMMYCFVFLLLIFTGGGVYALDAVRTKRRPTTG